ncbi:MAG: hypothetical protein ABSG15_14995 [FCB group bacterium]|jgi:hypothetical protein
MFDFKFIIEIAISLFIAYNHYNEKFELTKAIMNNPDNIVTLIKNSNFSYSRYIKNRLDTINDKTKNFAYLKKNIKKDFLGKNYKFIDTFEKMDFHYSIDPVYGNSTYLLHNIYVIADCAYDIEFWWMYVNNEWILYDVKIQSKQSDSQ